MSGNDRMELDDLLEREGLDAAGAEQTLAWARARAHELLGGVESDPELGPLLDGAAVVSPATPMPIVATSLAGAGADEDDDDATLDRATQAAASLHLVEPSSVAAPTDVVDEPSFGLSTAQAELEVAEAELEAAQALLAAAEAGVVPTETTAATTGSVPLDPLAGIDFDDLPSTDEEDEDGPAPAVAQASLADGRDAAVDGPETTMPSMTVSLDDDDRSLSTDGMPPIDVTQRSANPLDEAPDEAAQAASDEAASDEPTSDADADDDEEIEEIELLDEDDLMLVDEVAAASPPPAPAAADDDEPSEWRAALVSAQLGGGAQADQDSGLLRPPRTPPSDAES